MDTKAKQNGQAKVADTVKADKTPKFVAGNPVNKVSQKEAEEKEAMKQNAASDTAVQTNPSPEEPKVDSKAPQAEPSKMEVKASIAEKIAEQKAILERHIKLGDDLARKIKHRDNLKNIITTLEEFELELKDNADETDGNYYQGCLLTIKDDNGKTFTTKNPTIIRGVAEQVNSLCSDKLEEVEMDIVNLIPA